MDFLWFSSRVRKNWGVSFYFYLSLFSLGLIRGINKERNRRGSSELRCGGVCPSCTVGVCPSETSSLYSSYVHTDCFWAILMFFDRSICAYSAVNKCRPVCLL